MSIRSAACALLAVTTITAAACGADEDPPATVDAAVGPDGAAGVDAAIDAVPGPDADPSLEPTFTEVPCDAPIAMIEYYSCAFFIGGGNLRVGEVVQFVGCEGHTVRSATGLTLATSPLPVCYLATSPGTLTYTCQQHPDNNGSIVVAP
jgi:hypothetical protein